MGQTTKTLFRRISWHKFDARRGSNTKFYNAARKYGWDNFEWSVVFEEVPLDRLASMEDRGIELFDTINDGYNTIPSSGMSPMLLPEVAAKVSASCKGRVPWNRGVPRTPEEKAKMSAAKKGRKTGPSPLRGCKLTPEHREAIRRALMGNKYSVGRIVSDETRRKLSESRKGKTFTSKARGRPKTGAALEAVRKNVAKARAVWRATRAGAKQDVEDSRG